MRGSLSCALVVVLALAVAPLATGTSRASAQRQVTLEQGILREVNHVRVAHGLHPLALSRGLQAAAAFQTRALLAQGVFDHDSATSGAFGTRLRRFYPVGGAHGWSVGENLLWSSAGISAESAVKIWLESPGHRKIMLDPTWLEAGVGAFGTTSAPGVYADAGAVTVVTMDFGSRAAALRS
jgi:uncharacterized protein YkwD